MSQKQARKAANAGGRTKNRSIYANLSGQIGPVVPLDYLEVGRNIFPKHLLDDIDSSQIDKSDFGKHPIYAGPYRLNEDIKTDSPIILNAFDNFVLGTPSIKHIVFGASYSPGADPYYWQSPSLLKQAMESGAIQAQLGLPAVQTREYGIKPQDYDTLEEGVYTKVIWAPKYEWEVLDFNLSTPQLSDLRVRQAIAYAIDRQFLINTILNGHGAVMDSYIPP